MPLSELEKEMLEVLEKAKHYLVYNPALSFAVNDIIERAEQIKQGQPR